MNSAERLHQDLFDASVEHRLAHGLRCSVYPSPDAALWGAIAASLPVERVLEVGCGIGYQAACIATLARDCRIETIENDPIHPNLAQAEFERLGYEERITVLRGEAETILASLKRPYDLVIEDAGLEYPRWLPELARLTRSGGVLITRNLAGPTLAWDQFLPTDATTVVRAQPAD